MKTNLVLCACALIMLAGCQSQTRNWGVDEQTQEYLDELLVEKPDGIYYRYKMSLANNEGHEEITGLQLLSSDPARLQFMQHKSGLLFAKNATHVMRFSKDAARTIFVPMEGADPALFELLNSSVFVAKDNDQVYTIMGGPPVSRHMELISISTTRERVATLRIINDRLAEDEHCTYAKGENDYVVKAAPKSNESSCIIRS